MDRPRDVGPSGAQPERTALAWHRTYLSVLVAAAVVARLNVDCLGLWALLFLVAMMGAGAISHVRSQRDGPPAHPADATGTVSRPLWSLTVVVSAICVVELVNIWVGS